ncbi:MAG: fibrobacter succinogenes major paralogous domain-containing protein [Sphingobacteriales bacterium]|nr:MAG: fibrobacter succinogenes major paralogous domain-containing protein [Sphingobacteriales bacterium]
MNIYKDEANKEDGLLADVYDAETQYKTHFYGSYNDKGIPKEIKSIVLENKNSDTVYNYILDENKKIYLAYPSLKNGTKLGSVNKIDEDDSLLTINFFDYNWSNQTDVFIESYSFDINEDTDGARKTEEEPPIEFDFLGIKQLEKDIHTRVENFQTWLNEFTAGTDRSTFGLFSNSLRDGIESLNNEIKSLTRGGVDVNYNDFRESPTSDRYEPKENEYIPPSPTSNTNTIPKPPTPQNEVPQCFIATPLDGDKIPSSENINVSIYAYDIDGSILSVSLFLDGIKQGTKVAGVDADLNHFIIPANTLSKGYHSLYAIATDNKYKAKFSKSIIFKVEDDGSETVTDIDGNIYHTVKIGTQTWMVENLKTTRYNDGTAIPTGLSVAAWQATTNGAYAIYDNNAANNTTYGKLYNWYAVNTGKLAPAGWHVPTDAEWTTLTTYLGGESVAGDKMKATTLWTAFAGITNTNSSGFTGLPAGNFSYYYESFFSISSTTYFWSSTKSGTNAAWYRSLDYNYSGAFRDYANDRHGFSVRCIKD